MYSIKHFAKKAILRFLICFAKLLSKKVVLMYNFTNHSMRSPSHYILRNWPLFWNLFLSDRWKWYLVIIFICLPGGETVVRNYNSNDLPLKKLQLLMKEPS